MKYVLSPFFKAFLFALCYGILFYLLQFFFVRTGIFITEPTAHNLKSWDAGYYDDLRQNGYNAASDNTGFFILFPLIWKFSHLGVWGITALNVIFFSLGFAVLARTLKEEHKTFWLLWLTLPSVFFAFLPYTESLFFLLGTLVLYAVKENKRLLLWITLVLISLARSTSIFLIPAFIAMELFRQPRAQWFKSLWRALYRYTIPQLIGLSLFVIWQYRETGIWFAYFKTQAERWQHVFSFPGFPLSNLDNVAWRYHWLNALALLIDAIALIFLLWQLVLWLKRKPVYDEKVILSAGYLAMVLITELFYSPKYGHTNSFIGGSHRYTIMSPFFFVFLHFLGKQKYAARHILFFFLFIHAFWALFGVYAELNKYIAGAMVSNFLIVAFMLYSSREKYSWLIIPVIAFNFFMQFYLFQQFITPSFVD